MLKSFCLLSFVLGGGIQDVRFPLDGRLRIDMLVEQPSGFRLAVEYDGAYWHQDKEISDRRKSDRLVDSGFVHAVMRLREESLSRLSSLDLVIPSGAIGLVTAQLALLHLSHTLDYALAGRENGIRHFLTSAAEPIVGPVVTCTGCRSAAGYLSRQVFSRHVGRYGGTRSPQSLGVPHSRT